MADDLRARLIQVIVDEDEIEAALAAVAEWLRAEARELRRLAADAKDRRDHGEPNGEWHLQRFLAQAVALEGRALDALTQPSTEESR